MKKTGDPRASLCRMFENKMKELEKELAVKTACVSELRRRLKEMDEGEERAGHRIRQLEEQVRAGNTLAALPCIEENAPWRRLVVLIHCHQTTF